MEFTLGSLHAWVVSLAVATVVVLVTLVVHTVVFAAARRLASRTHSVLDDSLARHALRPTRLMLPIVAIFLILPAAPLPPDALAVIRHSLALVLIGAVAWLLIRLTDVLNDVIAAKYRVDERDNLAARKIHTQAQLFRRIAVVVVSIVALSVMLMTFPSIRHLGVSVFASAGIAGLVVGMAARPTLANLLAGVQIALTEPIRLDDVVIVEGEWGWIEEIATTYVVVRTWDLRRIVLPLSYFIEHPFQNWTRRTADILGTVFIYTDYTVPVEELRTELHRVLEASGQWDGKVWGMQVTNASAQALELRALMSAPDSGTAWDLRCYVREHLIGYLQSHYPHSLPRTRAELDEPRTVRNQEQER